MLKGKSSSEHKLVLFPDTWYIFYIQRLSTFCFRDIVSFSIFSSRLQSKAYNFVTNSALVALLITQLYCNCHIMFCKWKQFREERNMALPIIKMHPSDGDDRPNPSECHIPSPQLNTSTTNKILADAKHLILYMGFLMIYVVSTWWIKSIDLRDSTTWLKIPLILLYVCDLGMHFLIMFVCPLMFYFSHPELRRYWLGTCKRTRS